MRVACIFYMEEQHAPSDPVLGDIKFNNRHPLGWAGIESIAELVDGDNVKEITSRNSWVAVGDNGEDAEREVEADEDWGYFSIDLGGGFHFYLTPDDPKIVAKDLGIKLLRKVAE